MFNTNRGKFCLVVGLALVMVLVALPALAQAPKAVHRDSGIRNQSRGSVLIFSNLTGPNHHKYNPDVGYYVDGANFFNQVIAQGFTPSSSVTFADAYMPMAVYTFNGGIGGGTATVYLESDAGGQPGSILDGPLTPENGISKFPGNFVAFDCVTCPTLNAGTPYWIVGTVTDPTLELTWGLVRGITDISSGFAFNQVGSATGPWTVVPVGYSRAAYSAEGN